ncbi:MAG: type III pantothenate kinase [Gammaproteobacteria bacterium]|nr:MAG: type III pantothenate kinase [Gammaproteobacteria bacterium]
MTTILAIDSGNSFIKWGLFHDDQWIIQSKIDYEHVSHLKSEFDKLPEPDIILISHVARQETRNEICELISRWIAQTIWLQSGLFQCGVLNGYSDPKQLGSDRWAALIAAWKIEHKACLVINAGTAVTIDALSDSGQFLGGVILPGVHLMQNSLCFSTQLDQAKTGAYEDFPVNTNNAIHSGIIHCLVGAIEHMHSLLSERLHQTDISCIISGGGATLLVPLIKFPINNTVDNLVLEGLILIAKDEMCRQKLAISKDII